MFPRSRLKSNTRIDEFEKNVKDLNKKIDDQNSNIGWYHETIKAIAQERDMALKRIEMCNQFASKLFGGVIAYAASNSKRFTKAEKEDDGVREGGFMFKGGVESDQLFEMIGDRFSDIPVVTRQ